MKDFIDHRLGIEGVAVLEVDNERAMLEVDPCSLHVRIHDGVQRPLLRPVRWVHRR